MTTLTAPAVPSSQTGLSLIDRGPDSPQTDSKITDGKSLIFPSMAGMKKRQGFLFESGYCPINLSQAVVLLA